MSDVEEDEDDDLTPVESDEEPAPEAKETPDEALEGDTAEDEEADEEEGDDDDDDDEEEEAPTEDPVPDSALLDEFEAARTRVPDYLEWEAVSAYTPLDL